MMNQPLPKPLKNIVIVLAGIAIVGVVYFGNEARLRAEMHPYKEDLYSDSIDVRREALIRLTGFGRRSADIIAEFFLKTPARELMLVRGELPLDKAGENEAAARRLHAKHGINTFDADECNNAIYDRALNDPALYSKFHECNRILLNEFLRFQDKDLSDKDRKTWLFAIIKESMREKHLLGRRLARDWMIDLTGDAFGYIPENYEETMAASQSKLEKWLDDWKPPTHED